MARKPRTSLMLPVVLVLIAALLIGIFYLRNRTEETNRVYAAEAAITPEPTIAPPAIYAKPTEALLRSGSVGVEVQQLQQKLKELGFYTAEVDGQFGGGTKTAVVRFQEQHGLNPDGMAGAETLAAIYSANAKQMVVTPKPALPSSGQDLPMLVNRTNPIPDGYTPRDLVALKDVVPKDMLILKDPDVRANRQAVEALVKMIRAAQADGQQVWQVSEGYRTAARQQELFEQQVQQLITDEQLSQESARKAAEQTVALPGTSEHHTGLAFDLTVPGRFFGDTPQAQWLENHCFEHGFILRYTANKEEITGFLPEPWHVRYVGEAHARFMEEHNLALEEYLALYR